jgi:hypothetical protein
MPMRTSESEGGSQIMPRMPIVLLVSYALTAASWADGSAPTPVSGTNTVLIACQPSEFRTAVAARLVRKLRQDGCVVKSIDVTGLGTESAGKYDAVVICDAVWAWRMNGHVRRFLAKTDAALRGRVVVLNTAGDAEWRSKEPGIHAITAASAVTKVDGSVDMLLKQVRSVLRGLPAGAATGDPR